MPGIFSRSVRFLGGCLVVFAAGLFEGMLLLRQANASEIVVSRYEASSVHGERPSLPIPIGLTRAPKAAGGGSLVLASVDLEAVLQNAMVTKSVEKQIEVLQHKQQKEILRMDKRFSERDRQLQASQGRLLPAEFERQVADFQKEVELFQRQQQEQSAKLAESFHASMMKIRQMATQIVADLAVRRGYTAVLSHMGVVYVDPELDITDEVIQRLNQKIQRWEDPVL
jgi:outer membrane protein